jgi:hypothetical protein
MVISRVLTFPLLGACSLALALLASSHQTAMAADEAGSAVAPVDKPSVLFDGKSLGDCYTYLHDAMREDPRQVFTVQDDLLRVSGDGLGSLITNKAYRDYHLVLEYKWGEKAWHKREQAARDSGLLIHSNGADGGYGGIWMPSIEVQIIEGGVGDFVLVNGKDEAGQPVPISLTCEVTRDRDGEVVWKAGNPRETFDAKNRKRINWFGRDPDWKDEIGFRGPQDVDSPHGQWTRIDVLADGDHVETFVNGVKVNEAFGVSPSAGRIQLQTELAEVFFRRWELYPVGKGPKPAKAEN